MWSKK
jgi:hypothetical protein